MGIAKSQIRSVPVVVLAVVSGSALATSKKNQVCGLKRGQPHSMPPSQIRTTHHVRDSSKIAGPLHIIG